MYAADNNLDEVVSYFSLKTRNIDKEDSKGVNLLGRYLLREDFDMGSKLVLRGANINYVN